MIDALAQPGELLEVDLVGEPFLLPHSPDDPEQPTAQPAAGVEHPQRDDGRVSIDAALVGEELDLAMRHQPSASGQAYGFALTAA